MRTVYPDYYKDFCCTASACRHTCCAGWEIDIDSASMRRYAAAEGDLGRRLRDGIAGGENPHFVLTEGGRCPMLNDDGLCAVLLDLGEDALCDICAEHPRFHTFLSDRTETGLGLCCEEAARLLLSRRGPIRLLGEGGEKLTRGEKKLLGQRALAFGVLWRNGGLRARLDDLLFVFGASMAERPAREWADICLGLERMDGRWTALLEGLREVDGADVAEFDRRYPQTLCEYENLLWYFFYRHFLSAADSGSVAAPLRFAAVSWQIIHALDAAKFKRAGAFAPADRAEHARLYSAEIEYSDENMEAMLELLQ